MTARLLLSALILLLPAWPALGEESEVVSVALEWEPGFPGTVRGRVVEMKAAAPDGIRLPEDIGDCRYGKIVYYDTHRVRIVRDVAPGSDRLWIDSDFDDDFAEEPARTW